MKKNNTITIDNLPKQKLSAIFESVDADLDKVAKQGIEIDMSTFVHTNHTCTVCLGGAAVCGFFPKLDKEVLDDIEREVWHMQNGDRKTGKINGYRLTPKQTERLQTMSFMFDSFRQKDIDGVFTYFDDFSDTPTIDEDKKDDVAYEYEAVVNDKGIDIENSEDIGEIKEAINLFVKILKKYNL